MLILSSDELLRKSEELLPIYLSGSSLSKNVLERTWTIFSVWILSHYFQGPVCGKVSDSLTVETVLFLFLLPWLSIHLSPFSLRVNLLEWWCSFIIADCPFLCLLFWLEGRTDFRLPRHLIDPKVCIWFIIFAENLLHLGWDHKPNEIS